MPTFTLFHFAHIDVSFLPSLSSFESLNNLFSGTFWPVSALFEEWKILSGVKPEGEKAVDFEAIGYKENTTTVMSIGRCQ